MSVINKRILSIIVYYTLAALALISTGFFVFALLVRTLPMWAKTIYFVWSALVIGAVIFDIICTISKDGKQISGLIVYVLSVLAVIMAGILYVLNTSRTGLATDFFNIFLSVSLISLMATGYLIATWCVGEGLVEHKSAEEKIEARHI